MEQDIIRNREDEALGRKKKFKVESEVENWIHKYDQDLEEKQAEIDEITVCSQESDSVVSYRMSLSTLGVVFGGKGTFG